MSTQERKSILDLPVKVILTEAGTSFFINNHKTLKKFRLADNAEEYGIYLDRFTPISLQRMLLVDYISKVEVSKSEFMSNRQEIMDLSKLIVYSLLYRQYDTYIFSRMLSSDLIKKWNRLNPSNIIDDKTRINDEYLQGVLKEKEKDILQIKQQILGPLYGSINRNVALLPDEKNILLLLSEKFLTTLRPFIWFIIARFKGSDGYEQLLEDIRASLSEYMEKARIAEYVSLMIMELTSNAENSNLKREAKTVFKGTVDMNAVLFDPNIRRQVIESLERKRELVYLSWKLGSKSTSIGTQGRLQINIFNKESEYENMRRTIDEKKSADLKKKSLQDFYKELPNSEANTELGLYYLSYLSEACDKVGVKFESHANQVPGLDLTLVTLGLSF